MNGQGKEQPRSDSNTAPDFIYVLPPIANRCAVVLSLDHSWFKKGIRLEKLSSFCDVVRLISRGDNRPIGGGGRPQGGFFEEGRRATSPSLPLFWREKKKHAKRHLNTPPNFAAEESSTTSSLLPRP